VANSAGRLGLGLDVRGQGGLVLAPPSRCGLGAYRWAIGGPATVPAIPTAWRKLLRPRQPKPAPAAGSAFPLDGGRDAARLASLIKTLQQAPEGQHNNVVYWAACRLKEMLDQGAPESWVEVLIEAGIRIGTVQDASWRRAVRATVASALGRNP
jgi:Bifunctional DNA primase/polymerase, N-terminal